MKTPSAPARHEATRLVAWMALLALSGCADDSPPGAVDVGAGPDDVQGAHDASAPDLVEADAIAAETTDDASAEDAPDTAEPPVPRVRFLITERPQSEEPEIEATEARYGDPIRVVVDGLAPSAEVTVRASGGAGSSQAVFVADAEGVVDLARDAPQSGDWAVAHGDAFLWSMTDPPGGPLDLTITVTAEIGGEEVAAGTLARHYINQDIVTEPVADGTTVGTLALPPGEGPFGGVLCFGGSEGGTGTGEFRAMYLASLGYAALGVGYFGADGLPADLTDVPLEILEGALDRLVSDPRVDPGGVVVVGGSRGGELALLLGAYFSAVRGIVAEVPSGYVWGSAGSLNAAAWTYQGAPLPYVPSSGAFPGSVISSEGVAGFESSSVFVADIAAATDEELAAATIAAEVVDGPILLIGGADDLLWPSCLLSEVTMGRLQASDHAETYGDLMICAPDAGHRSVGTPGWSQVGSTSTVIGGFTYVLGGTVAGNGAALRANDTALRDLLERVHGPGKITPPTR